MRALRPFTRRAVLTVHVISSVGLLGAPASMLGLALTGAGSGDPELAQSAYRLMGTFGLVFGVPLNLGGLISGVILGLTSKWGVFRIGWVTAKLALIVATIHAGALVIGPGADQMAEGNG